MSIRLTVPSSRTTQMSVPAWRVPQPIGAALLFSLGDPSAITSAELNAITSAELSAITSAEPAVIT
jgi:hypothetical protein